MEVAELMVTDELPRVTTPVKSSMRSSWPAARVLPVRGKVKALRTLVLAKFTVRALAAMVTALAILRSKPMPDTAFAETEYEIVATGLLEAGTLRGQMVSVGQPEMVAAVSFKKVMMALPERTKVALLY